MVYPGSIERVNFGEAADEKYFLIADIKKGKTILDWRRLENIRPFVDVSLMLGSSDDITEQVKKALPSGKKLDGAVTRLVLEYPKAWDPLIDENSIRDLVKDSFEFHFLKQPQYEPRIRLPKGQAIGSLTPEELLDQYWTPARHRMKRSKPSISWRARSCIQTSEVCQTYLFCYPVITPRKPSRKP